MIRFNFSDFIYEIKSFKKVCSSFVQNKNVIDEYAEKLKRVRDEYADEEVEVSITDDNPLLTNFRDGKYDSSGGGGERVFGKVTSVWQIKPIQDENLSSHKEFEISGKASTKVCLLDESYDRISMWKIEIGVEDSPGTHFHIQVEGDNGERPYPEWISVPRFPSILVTVPDVIDFLLGELFQNSWIKHASKSSDEMNRWRPHQQRRLSSLLEWKTAQVNNTMGSGWIAIKNGKPNPDLFLQSN
jgi:hypothetical protein